MRWNISIHISIWGYEHIRSDGDSSDNGCVGTDPNPITKSRSSRSCASVFAANRNTLVQVAILTQFCFRIDGDSVSMTKI